MVTLVLGCCVIIITYCLFSMNVKLSTGPIIGGISPIHTAILWDVDDEIF